MVTGPHTNKIWADALLRAAKRLTNQKTSNKPTQRLERLADTVVKLALKGDMSATREIGDRLDGKATQQINLRRIRSMEDLDEDELIALARGK